MTEDQARAICGANGATLSIKQRSGIYYVYVSRWLPSRAAAAAGYTVHGGRGQQFERYVCPLAKLADLDEATLRQRIAALPINPNKMRAAAGGQVAAANPSAQSRAVLDLLATVPHERTGIVTWATKASRELSIPREQLAYRLALYRDQLSACGVRLAQSTRHRTLFVPMVGRDEGAYYSHIWREHEN
jgi:hypothetical protein